MMRWAKIVVSAVAITITVVVLIVIWFPETEPHPILKGNR
jgi:hypothetical protein